MWTPSLWLESPQISLKFKWFLWPLGLKGQLPLTLCFPQGPLEFSGLCSDSSFHSASAPLSSASGAWGLLFGEDEAFAGLTACSLSTASGAAARLGTSLRGLQASASHPSSLLTPHLAQPRAFTFFTLV